VLLQQGRVAFDGSPREATDLYQAGALVKLDKQPEAIAVADRDAGQRGMGSLTTSAVSLLKARFTDEAGHETTVLVGDRRARLEFSYAIHRDLDDPHVGFKVRDKFGTVLFETNTYCMHQKIGPCSINSRLNVAFEFRALLAPGEYTITAGFANRGFAEGSFEEALSYLHGVLAFSVVRHSSSVIWLGSVNLEPQFAMEKQAITGTALP
jgi:lipopolysaccharide transport system ATP-binding protein